MPIIQVYFACCAAPRGRVLTPHPRIAPRPQNLIGDNSEAAAGFNYNDFESAMSKFDTSFQVTVASLSTLMQLLSHQGFR